MAFVMRHRVAVMASKSRVKISIDDMKSQLLIMVMRTLHQSRTSASGSPVKSGFSYIRELRSKEVTSNGRFIAIIDIQIAARHWPIALARGETGDIAALHLLALKCLA